MKKKRFRKSTEQFVFIYQNDLFHSFFNRLIRLNFSFFFRRIIDYCKQKNVDENVCFNCYEQDHIATNCSKSKKRIIQMNNFNSIFDDDFDSMHIIKELNSNHVNLNIDFNFK